MKRKTKVNADVSPHPAVGILSLGCPRNIVDSKNILNRLKIKSKTPVEAAG